MRIQGSDRWYWKKNPGNQVWKISVAHWAKQLQIALVEQNHATTETSYLYQLPGGFGQICGKNNRLGGVACTRDMYSETCL